MTSIDTIRVHFAGIDRFERAVFATADGSTLYKSVELTPHLDSAAYTVEEWEGLLRTLYTTDGVEGEPGYPVPREHFLLMEYHHAHTRP